MGAREQTIGTPTLVHVTWQLSATAGPIGHRLTADLRGLLARCVATDGVAPMSDATLLAPSSGATYLFLRSGASEELAGCAVLDGESVELAVRPERRGAGAGGVLVTAALARGARQAWAHGNLPGAQRLAAEHDAHATRRLLVLDIDSAAIDSAPLVWPPGFGLRSYSGPDDDAQVLAVNRAAFTDLPDQGSWSMADLAARTGADWFRPDGLLLLLDQEAQRLAGFHWTKIHPTGECEVYVVALDPAYQGHGLGTRLIQAGLNHLRDGACPRVMLYVDAANTKALRVYRQLGFRQAREDILYAARSVPASDPGVWQG